MANNVFNARAVRRPNKRPMFLHLWLNKGEPETGPDAPLCSTALQYIKNVVKVADGLKGGDFYIGLDYEKLDTTSLFWVHSYAYACMKDPSKEQNLFFVDLSKIPSYEGVPAFNKEPVFRDMASDTDTREAPGSVYVRVDYARVLFMYHMMRTNPDRRYFVYADMDLKKFSWARMKRALDKYGLCLHKAGRAGVPNGLIGLNTSYGRVRRFAPWWLRQARVDATHGLCGYPILEMYIRKVFPGYRERLPEFAHFYLPEVGRTLRPDPLLQELRIIKP